MTLLSASYSIHAAVIADVPVSSSDKRYNQITLSQKNLSVSHWSSVSLHVKYSL